MSRLSEFFNAVTNDGSIFSIEDVANIPEEEAGFYQKALDYQYGKIGFPSDKELQSSSDVVHVRAYTRDDGTKVRAHYRSKNGHHYADPNKRIVASPKEEKARIEELARKIMDKGEVTGLEDKVEKEKLHEGIINSLPIDYLQQGVGHTRRLADGGGSLKGLPNSVEYYRIALTKGKSVEDHDTDNIKCTVKDVISNEKLYEHILGIDDGAIKPDDMLIVPKPEARIVKDLKDSDVIKEKLIENKAAIKSGKLQNSSIEEVEFNKNEPDLKCTLGRTHIYNPQIDNKGNLHLLVIDWYDFEHIDINSLEDSDDRLFAEINNNGYAQQKRNALKNYVLAIKITYTKEELEKFWGK